MTERQLKITDFTSDKVIRVRYIHTLRRYKTNTGLSERQIKKLLEKQGWEVWRSELLNIVREVDVYSNVRRKYERLLTLLYTYHDDKVPLLQYWCDVNHGLPDFICYRSGIFKFVECKLNHEQLSPRQKRCIERLQEQSFTVEVIKFVTKTIRIRAVEMNYHTGHRKVLERQLALVSF
ncbi:MAG: VRR-NUC domain-containing protein [Candidatus Nanoarchaeia archaeon]